MTAIDPADIAAMRAEGSLGEFLRHLAGRPSKLAAPEQVHAPELPRSRPGAWPDGTRPPSPVPPMPAANVQAAIDDYRAWIAAGEPASNNTCPCPACQRKGTA